MLIHIKCFFWSSSIAVRFMFMLKNKVYAKIINAPCAIVKLLVVISRIQVSDKLVQQGSFTRQWATVPVMTCLDALPSPWLMQAICDIWMQTRRRIKARRKTRCSYFNLMMLLCSWRLRPKYLSHNSYLVLGRQHYCSAGGRVNAYLAHSESGVLLQDSSL